MKICSFYEICDRRVHDDICLESLFCKRRSEYMIEKREKIEKQKDSRESWVERLIEYNGDITRR